MKIQRQVTRLFRLSVIAALAIVVTGSSGPAQSPVPKPIRLVVPFIAGSPVDALARVVVQHVAPRLGRTIVVENQAGAGGAIGSKAVADAEPDGQTLLFGLNAMTYGLAVNPGFDPERSFAPVAMVAQWSHVLVVRPDFPADTVRSLIAHATANPDTVLFGYGIGTPPQILGETLKRVSGATFRSIPYRGGAQAIQDMLGGRIDMNFGTTATLLPLIREGKLRAIAYTGARRLPDLPEVPTIAEAGFPELAWDPDAWAAVLAPAGTPAAVVAGLNRTINESLRSPDLQPMLRTLGFEPRTMSPGEFGVFLAAEAKRWPAIVAAAGLRAE